MQEDEEKNKENLAEERRKRPSPIDTAKNLKDLAKSATPIGAPSLAKYIELTDLLFVLPLMIAILKDLLDLVGIGSLPAIGTVITFMASILIGLFMLMLGGGGGKRKVAKAIVRYLVLIGGTATEGFLFGLNFMPIETLTVIIVYWLILKERKEVSESESFAPQENYA